MILFDVIPFREIIYDGFPCSLQCMPIDNKSLTALDTDKEQWFSTSCSEIKKDLKRNGHFGYFYVENNYLYMQEPLTFNRVFFKLGDYHYLFLTDINGYSYIVFWHDGKVFFVQYFAGQFENIIGISAYRNKFNLYQIMYNAVSEVFINYIDVLTLLNEGAIFFREMTEEEFIQNSRSGFFEALFKIGQV